MQYLEADEVNVTETRSHRYPTYATPILIIVRYCIYKNIRLIFFFETQLQSGAEKITCVMQKVVGSLALGWAALGLLL